MKKTGKKWLGLHFSEEDVKKTNGVPNSATAVTDEMKKQNGDKLISKKRIYNFHSCLTPKTVADLAVHPKKIGEVESWLQMNVINNKNNTNAKFLLISGPTGSGKSVTLQVLCRKMSIDITEWLNPMDHDFEVFHGLNQVTRFIEFLTDSKWNSLFACNNKKVIIVEEFPNALIRKPEDFGAVLEECYFKGNHPVIFICTESFDTKSNLIEKIFTQEIRNKYKIAQISFNPCATTLLKNALRRAHDLIQENADSFKTPSHSTVNAILATSMGDIKCAINQYYFASLLGTTDLPVTEKSQKSGTKRKRNESASSSVQIMSRDENLGLFHGIGRVLNPKRTNNGSSWRLNCNMDKLIDEFSTQPGIFTAFLFENYLKYYGDLNDVHQAAEILSLSQTFLEKWVDRHDVLTFALWVSVLGLMVHNEHKVSKWNQITGPKKAQRRVTVDNKERSLSVMDLFYYNVINKVENSHFIVNV